MDLLRKWFDYNARQLEIQQSLEKGLAALPDCEMTLNEFYLLHHLMQADYHEVRQNDIVNFIPITSSAISRMLMRLETKCNSIRREKCEEDKRATYVILTEEGKDWYQKGLKKVNEVLAVYEEDFKD